MIVFLRLVKWLYLKAPLQLPCSRCPYLGNRQGVCFRLPDGRRRYLPEWWRKMALRAIPQPRVYEVVISGGAE